MNTSTLANRRQFKKQLRIVSTTQLQTKINTNLPQYHKSYQNGPIAILPYLYIGNETNAHSLEQLNNIDCILNVATEVKKPLFKNIVSWSMKIDNIASENTIGYHKLVPTSTIINHNDEQLKIQDAIDLIDQAKKHNKVVLVHCQCGVARSATIVIAYIMHCFKISMQDAYNFVQRRAPAVGPSFSLLYQLQLFERQIFMKSSSSSFLHHENDYAKNRSANPPPTPNISSPSSITTVY
ncbi:unnamed protein product [Cunninghamella blakesleeana]